MWYEYLDDNIFLVSLYNEVPPLTDVRIAEIKLFEEGDRASISFDMPRFVDRLPKKWEKLGYNTIVVQVDFFDVHAITISSSKNRYKGNVEIKRDENGSIVVDISGNLEVKLKANVGNIASVRGYCNLP